MGYNQPQPKFGTEYSVYPAFCAPRFAENSVYRFATRGLEPLVGVDPVHRPGRAAARILAPLRHRRRDPWESAAGQRPITIIYGKVEYIGQSHYITTRKWSFSPNSHKGERNEHFAWLNLATLWKVTRHSQRQPPYDPEGASLVILLVPPASPCSESPSSELALRPLQSSQGPPNLPKVVISPRKPQGQFLPGRTMQEVRKELLDKAPAARSERAFRSLDRF